MSTEYIARDATPFRSCFEGNNPRQLGQFDVG